MANDIQKIIRKSSDPKLIELAFDFALSAYKDKFRLSGENYIERAVRVALMLDKMNLDPTTVALGLLYDILDDLPGLAQKNELAEVEKKFGKEMGFLVEKFSDLKKIQYSLSVDIKEKRTFSRE